MTTMQQRKNKEKLVREFQLMQDFEGWAKDFYLQISSDPKIKKDEVREIFKDIANDEERHAKMVQRILNIISNNL